MRVILILFLAIFTTESEQLDESKPLNILGVFPYQGRSHFNVFEPYLQELTKRGHNVTVISYFPQKKPLKNYHDIRLEAHDTLEGTISIGRSYLAMYSFSKLVLSKTTENCRTLLSNKDVQNLWKSRAKFDVVVVEQFCSDCPLALAYQLGAPVIGITSHTMMPWHYDRFGVPKNPSYISSQFLGGGSKPFYQRLERAIMIPLTYNLYKVESQHVDQNTIARYLNDVPPLDELEKDIKILLVYTNPILFGTTLY